MQPRRSTVGDFNSQAVMPASISAMHTKNTATGVVQAIQLNMVVFLETTAMLAMRHDSSRLT